MTESEQAVAAFLLIIAAGVGGYFFASWLWDYLGSDRKP
jgi:hypothetical protein